MNTPNVPSSSLYRFKAVLGLLIITASMFFIVYLIVDYNKKSMIIITEIENLNSEVESVAGKQDEIKNRAIAICELNNCKCVDDNGVLVSPVFQKGPPLIHHKQKELKELYTQYEQMSKDIRSKRNKISARTHLMDNYWDFGNRFFIMVVLVVIVGFVILFTGFRDWKNKVQKYQDTILEAQARQLNSNNEYMDTPKQKKMTK